MEVKRFFSSTMQDALRMVREEFGAEAVILSNSKMDGGVEIVAALDYEDGWDEQALEQEIAQHGAPSPSQLARMHAEKHLQLQREMAQARRKIESARNNKYKTTNSDVAAQRSGGADLEKQVNPKQATEKSTVQKRANEDDALSAMRAEILEIKDLLARQPQKQTVESQKSLLEQQLEKTLDSLCLSVSARQTVMNEFAAWQKASSHRVGNPEPQFEQTWKHLSQFIEKSIRVEHTEIIDREGVFALVGPTGSGKTMTIGKMAARYVMEYGPENIALVTTDRFRIAAHEQLKVFGRILNIPVHAVDESHSLDVILDKLSHKKFVLIDTAGLMHTDSSWSEQLQEIKLSGHAIECYLTVAAVGQYQVMSANYHHYKMLDLSGVVVTKVDEAVSLGEVLSFLMDTGLKASYYTDGQRVPEDIHLFDSHTLFEKAQLLLNSSERWVTIRSEDPSLHSLLKGAAGKLNETKLYHSA